MSNNKSFTLIELLVVISIIGLLSSIVMVYLKGAKEKAQLAKAISYASQVHHVLGAYAAGIWDFNEGSGATAKDLSSNKYDGTISGAVWKCDSSDTPAGEGCSLHFDGNNDYVDMGVHRPFLTGEGSEPITISLWIKRSGDSVDATPRIASTDCSEYWCFHLTDYGKGLLRFRTKHSDAKYYDVDYLAGFSINKWYHIIGSYNPASGEKKLYINGEEEGSRIISGSPEIGYQDIDRPLGIASNVEGTVAGNNVLNGLIDDVRVYREILSSAQIKKLYVQGLKKHELSVNDR